MGLRTAAFAKKWCFDAFMKKSARKPDFYVQYLFKAPVELTRGKTCDVAGEIWKADLIPFKKEAKANRATKSAAGACYHASKVAAGFTLLYEGVRKESEALSSHPEGIRSVWTSRSAPLSIRKKGVHSAQK